MSLVASVSEQIPEMRMYLTHRNGTATELKQAVRSQPHVKAVWKFDLNTSRAVIAPNGSKALCVHEQNGHICLWMEVDPQESRTERHYFDVVGTGWDIPQDVSREYVGTVLQANGALVWHVYERFE